MPQMPKIPELPMASMMSKSQEDNTSRDSDDEGGIWDKYKSMASKVSTASANIITLISLFLPASMIVVGAVYINSCPAERYIPVYLIVAGAFYTFYAIIRLLSTFCMDSEGNRPRSVVSIMGIMNLFMFAWFIAGNVWIYRLKDKYSVDYGDPNYCNNTLYLYAFWVTTVNYILIGVALIIVCCAACCVGCIFSCIACCRSEE